MSEAEREMWEEISNQDAPASVHSPDSEEGLAQTMHRAQRAQVEHDQRHDTQLTIEEEQAA